MSEHVLDILKCAGVVMQGHFEGASGRHFNTYIEMDKLFVNPEATGAVSYALADKFRDYGIEVVVGVAKGGIVLSHGVAYNLSWMTVRRVRNMVAARAEEVLLKIDDVREVSIHYENIRGEKHRRELLPGSLGLAGELILRQKDFTIPKCFSENIAGRRVLVVDDVLTTGQSVRLAVVAARTLGANVVGVGVVWNRGLVTEDDLGNVSELKSLVDVKLRSWSVEECNQCKQGVPLNTFTGHVRNTIT